MDVTDDPLVGLRQAAELSQVDKRQISRWVEQGRLEPADFRQRGGKPQPLYRLSDIQRLKEERTKVA
jgi:DNA-binding transcriptional MerR regulator